MNWDTAIRALVLIKIGQELGHSGKMAETVHAFVEFLISAACVLR